MNTTNQAPLPSAMPRKTNPMHIQILGSMLKVGETTRKELRSKFNKKTNKSTDLLVDVPVPTIAGNISSGNVDIASKRWMR